MLCSVFHLRNGPLFYIAIISISLLFKVNSAVESVLETSPQPIVAVAGDDVTLPCRLNPPADTRTFKVKWIKPDLDNMNIHWLEDGRHNWTNQYPAFKYRTVMFMDQLIIGNVSLRIFRVLLTDAGQYHCIVYQMRVPVQLVVGAVSTPTVEVSSINSQQVVLQCRSEGWYPEPSLSWLDGEGNLIPADHEETVKTADGLYDIVSTVVVKQHGNYTCRVQNPLNQTRHRLIRVPADFFRESDTPWLWIRVFMVAFLVIVPAILLALYICRNQGRSNSLSREAMLGPNSTDGSQIENPSTSENHPEDHNTAQHSTEQPGQESSDGNCSSWNGGSDACETSDQY